MVLNDCLYSVVRALSWRMPCTRVAGVAAIDEQQASESAASVVQGRVEQKQRGTVTTNPGGSITLTVRYQGRKPADAAASLKRALQHCGSGVLKLKYTAVATDGKSRHMRPQVS